MPKFIVEYEIPLDDHFTFKEEIAAENLNSAIKYAIKKHGDAEIILTYNEITQNIPAKIKAKKISLLEEFEKL